MLYDVGTGKVCGIYKIENLVDGKVYVGKSKNVRSRYRQYVRDQERQAGYHMNQYLLRAMNKHGVENFRMSIIEECDESVLSTRELHWMTTLDSLGDNGYNLRSDTDQGMVVHPKTSKRITDRLKSEWASGLRDGHSDKLKESWLLRNRDDQSALMSKTLTKWMYKIDDGEPIAYKELADMGLGGVMSPFHRKKSDCVTFKGHKIERIRVK